MSDHNTTMAVAKRNETSASECSPESNAIEQIASARRSQTKWQTSSLKTRQRLFHALRHHLLQHATQLAAVAGPSRAADALAAEVLPLLDACRFLEKNLARLLRPRLVGSKGRPLWLSGVKAEVCREPWGVVLIVGPSNYPVLLPGVQTLQAIAAGNAVAVKPARGCSAAMELLQSCLEASGLDRGLLQILPEADDSVAAAIKAEVSKVVLTGSIHAGRAVQRLCADATIPCTMELSGCDASFVTASADLDRAASCLAVGMLMNDGRTCIAPRRVFVDRKVRAEFESKLIEQIQSRNSGNSLAPSAAGKFAANLVGEAVAEGATLLLDGIERDSTNHEFVAGSTVLTKASLATRLLQADVFAPVLTIVPWSFHAPAIRTLNDACPYALGASIFTQDEVEAQQLAAEVAAGSVVINDCIVPTADPRLPFGGRKQSGFGVTRGEEGLLEMTQLKVISRRQGRWLPHLDAPSPHDEQVLHALIRVSHAPRWRDRLAAAWRLMKASRGRRGK